jgi:putative sigma-54 modulation protein
MRITIESPHFTLSQRLTEYITTKVNKLEHLNERIVLTEVCLKLDKSSTNNNKICEIKVFAPQLELFANHHCMTFEDAVTGTIHALEKQLRKHKTKREKGKDIIQIEDTEEETTE